MKTSLRPYLLMLLLGFAVAAVPLAVAADATDLSLLVGRWQLDPSRTQMGRFGPDGKNMVRDPTFTFIFSPDPQGLKIEVFDRYPQAEPNRTALLIPDGQVHACQSKTACQTAGGDPSEQTFVYRAPDPHLVVRQFYVKGQLTEYSTYEVSADGKTFTMIAWSPQTPYWQNIQVFTRQVAAEAVVERGPVGGIVDPIALPGDFADMTQESQLGVSLGPPAGTRNSRPALVDTTPSPGADLAMQAVQAVVATCAADGYVVAAAVTDAKGKLKAAMAPDGTRSNGVYMALRKDVTVVTFGMSTLDVREKLAADPSLRSRIQPNMALLPGGLPIFAGNRLIGAIAASGAAAHEEEKCANAGLARIKEGLR